MICRRCGGTNVTVQYVQIGAVTHTKKKGCLYGIGRLALIWATCGGYLLIGRLKSKSKTNFENEKRAVCSSCGHSWKA